MHLLFEAFSDRCRWVSRGHRQTDLSAADSRVPVRGPDVLLLVAVRVLGEQKHHGRDSKPDRQDHSNHVNLAESPSIGPASFMASCNQCKTGNDRCDTDRAKQHLARNEPSTCPMRLKSH